MITSTEAAFTFLKKHESHRLNQRQILPEGDEKLVSFQHPKLQMAFSISNVGHSNAPFSPCGQNFVVRPPAGRIDPVPDLLHTHAAPFQAHPLACHTSFVFRPSHSQISPIRLQQPSEMGEHIRGVSVGLLKSKMNKLLMISIRRRPSET